MTLRGPVCVHGEDEDLFKYQCEPYGGVANPTLAALQLAINTQARGRRLVAVLESAAPPIFVWEVPQSHNDTASSLIVRRDAPMPEDKGS